MHTNSESHWANLPDVNPFLLDNSLRETVVGSTRAQTVAEKREVFDLLQRTGLKEVILGSFGRHPRTDDFFIEHLAKEGLITEGHYVFAELFDQVLDGLPSNTDSRGIINARRYGIRNLVVEFDINTPQFDAWGGTAALTGLCTHRCIQFRQQKDSRQLFFNLRDFPSAMRRRPSETLEIVKHLAQLPTEIRPCGLLVEDPTGEIVPYLFGDWIARLRETATKHQWMEMELLVHVHKGFGLSETITLEALASGATGVWAGLCDTGVGVGHNSSLLTFTNLARMGNQHVLERFDLATLRDVAREIYQLATRASIPDTAEIFSDRAFDMIFNGGFGHEHNLARLFGANARNRISELADHQMLLQRLQELQPDHPWDPVITSLMAIDMQKYLRFNASIDLNVTPSLILRYITAGGEVPNDLLNQLLGSGDGAKAATRWHEFRAPDGPTHTPPLMDAAYFIAATDRHASEHWNFQLDPTSAWIIERLYFGKDAYTHHQRNDLIGALWTWAILKRYGPQSDHSLEAQFVSQFIIPEYLRLVHSENDRSARIAGLEAPSTEADHPLFFSLPETARQAIFSRASTVCFPADTLICRFLDQGDTFYKVISGQLAVYQDDDCVSQVGTLGPGDFFGELAAFTGRQRVASVKALDEVVVLSIPSPLQVLASHEREIFQNDINGIIGIYEAWYLSNRLRDLPLGNFITMLRFGQLVDFEPNTTLIRRGGAMSHLHIIISGVVDVHLSPSECIQLKTGDVFGEMSILDQTHARAEVVTRTRCRLAGFTPEAAQDMIHSNPKFAELLVAISQLRKV
jgi:CRP-like cAMP-binding protein